MSSALRMVTGKSRRRREFRPEVDGPSGALRLEPRLLTVPVFGRVAGSAIRSIAGNVITTDSSNGLGLGAQATQQLVQNLWFGISMTFQQMVTTYVSDGGVAPGSGVPTIGVSVSMTNQVDVVNPNNFYGGTNVTQTNQSRSDGAPVAWAILDTQNNLAPYPWPVSLTGTIGISYTPPVGSNNTVLDQRPTFAFATTASGIAIGPDPADANDLRITYPTPLGQATEVLDNFYVAGGSFGASFTTPAPVTAAQETAAWNFVIPTQAIPWAGGGVGQSTFSFTFTESVS